MRDVGVSCAHDSGAPAPPTHATMGAGRAGGKGALALPPLMPNTVPARQRAANDDENAAGGSKGVACTLGRGASTGVEGGNTVKEMLPATFAVWLKVSIDVSNTE